ncbi:MAG: 50S ribosomal protein L1 [Candidatus Buchananbacteria bacterium]|nr:50S ribosomal protein L1 [Candidatus Buchananbacteria bacterium]
MKRSKRYQELIKKVDKTKVYSIEEAIKLIKETGKTKFDSSVEVHARLGIDPKKSDQQVRGAVSLPHGTGKTKRIAAFVMPDKEKEAKEAGADVVGGQELIEEIKKTGKCDFDVAVATPDIMPKMAVVAKTLGPRGLMPSPKNETITTNLKKTIGELKKGKVSFKNDDTSNVHQIIGKVSFDDKQLLENYTAFIDVLKKSKPSSAKGTFIQNVSISSTMGPGIKVQL